MSFGEKAFLDCTSLVFVELNGSAILVDGGYQFAFCYSLNPDNLIIASSLPPHAFNDCINLKTITFATDLSIAMGEKALQNVELKTITFLQDFKGAFDELKQIVQHADRISCPLNSCIADLAYEGYPIFIMDNESAKIL